MEQQTALTLKSSKLRYAGTKWLIFSGASILGVLSSMLTELGSPTLMYSLDRGIHFTASFMVGGLVGALLSGFFADIEKYTITVSCGIIAGPSQKDHNQRISFAIDRLDLIATCNRSFFQKINSERILCSHEGEKILLNEAVFPPAQVRAFLQRLNITT